MTPEERLVHFRKCTRFLIGHGPQRLRPAAASLAQEAGEGERGDVYGKGERIERLEREVAEILGKPAAVFMPSGTTAQQIALRIWCDRRACRVVRMRPPTLQLHEQRAYEHLHGLEAQLAGEASLFTRADLDASKVPSRALLIELPQREIGGQLPTWEDLRACVEWASARGPPSTDGARLLGDAAVLTAVPSPRSRRCSTASTSPSTRSSVASRAPPCPALRTSSPTRGSGSVATAGTCSRSRRTCSRRMRDSGPACHASRSTWNGHARSRGS